MTLYILLVFSSLYSYSEKSTFSILEDHQVLKVDTVTLLNESNHIQQTFQLEADTLKKLEILIQGYEAQFSLSWFFSSDAKVKFFKKEYGIEGSYGYELYYFNNTELNLIFSLKIEGFDEVENYYLAHKILGSATYSMHELEGNEKKNFTYSARSNLIDQNNEIDQLFKNHIDLVKRASLAGNWSYTENNSTYDIILDEDFLPLLIK
ncbi:MAG: hypothetical protein RLO12_16525 [Fulvivirga sp.]